MLCENCQKEIKNEKKGPHLTLRSRIIMLFYKNLQRDRTTSLQNIQSITLPFSIIKCHLPDQTSNAIKRILDESGFRKIYLGGELAYSLKAESLLLKNKKEA